MPRDLVEDRVDLLADEVLLGFQKPFSLGSLVTDFFALLLPAIQQIEPALNTLELQIAIGHSGREQRGGADDPDRFERDSLEKKQSDMPIFGMARLYYRKDSGCCVMLILFSSRLLQELERE